MLDASFIEINERDQLQVNGGIGLLGVLGLLALGAVGGIASNEYVERKTGDDIPTHVGKAIKHAGEKIKSIAQPLLN